MEEALPISKIDKRSPQSGFFYGNVWIIVQILTGTTEYEYDWIAWNLEMDWSVVGKIQTKKSISRKLAPEIKNRFESFPLTKKLSHIRMPIHTLISSNGSNKNGS